MSARTIIRALSFAALVMELAACHVPVTPACQGESSGATPTATQVCDHLQMLACNIQECTSAYSEWQSRVTPVEFDRLVRCYARSESCEVVDNCARACGPDGGALAIDGSDDATTDAVTDIAVDTGTDDAADAATLDALDATATDDAEASVDASDATDAIDTVSLDVPLSDIPAVDAATADVFLDDTIDVAPLD